MSAGIYTRGVPAGVIDWYPSRELAAARTITRPDVVIVIKALTHSGVTGI